MKKTLAAAAVLMSISGAHAGSMGPVDTQPAFNPYLAGEASYTWPSVGSNTLNAYSLSKTNQGWGGRLGVGMQYDMPSLDKFKFLGEIGGGYYGSYTLSNAVGGVLTLNNTQSISGYDILVGGLYNFNQFDIFGQIGFMAENVSVNGYQNLALVDAGSAISGQVHSKDNYTQVFPEIKVGGIYNLNANWGLMVDYLHVFGATPSMNVDFSATPTGVVNNQTYNSQNPTLDSVLFGIRYNIV